MSEHVKGSQQNVLVIGLASVAVLLGVIVGLLVFNGNRQVPGAVASDASQQQQPPAGMGTPATDANFDPATATRVPAGVEPEAYVEEYYEAVMAEDFETAFNHQPADKQVGGSAEALGEQLKSYGITGYEVLSATVEGDTCTVVVDQTTGEYGTFENTWVLVKDGEDWVVKAKSVTGMK